MCPKNYKILLSISRFTRDNNVSVKFINNYCFIKDKDSTDVLLQGILRNGLYQLQLPSNRSSTCCSTSISSQYQTLSNKTTKNVEDHGCKNISFNMNKMDINI